MVSYYSLIENRYLHFTLMNRVGWPLTHAVFCVSLSLAFVTYGPLLCFLFCSYVYLVAFTNGIIVGKVKSSY